MMSMRYRFPGFSGLSICLALCLLLSSCDCMRTAQGIVTDAETGLPLAGVEVYLLRSEGPGDRRITKSDGRFELMQIAGGFRCPDLTVIAKAEGYREFRQETGSDTGMQIQLVPINP